MLGIGFWAASASGGAAAGSYELISTTVLGSTSTSVTLSSIPSTYRHLQIRMTGRIAVAAGTGSFEFDMRLNGDTATNYSWHTLRGTGSSVTSSGFATQAQMAFDASLPSASQASGVFGAGVVDILDYSQTSKYKTVRGLSGWGSGQVQLSSGSWRSTTAVSSITLFDVNGWGFATGSRFSLYGIAG